jgi:hypothetical protein
MGRPSIIVLSFLILQLSPLFLFIFIHLIIFFPSFNFPLIALSFIISAFINFPIAPVGIESYNHSLVFGSILDHN